MRFVGCIETARFRLQPLVTLLQLLQLLIGIALMRRFELECLFGLRDTAAFGVQFGLRIAPTGFERRHGVMLGGGFVFGQRGFFFGDGQLLRCVFEIVLRLLRLRLPLLALRGQGGNLRLHAVTRFDDELDLGFEAADLGIRLVQRALRTLHRVAGGVMRDAQRFELRFDFAQLRGLRFEVDLRLLDCALLAFLLAAGFVLAQQPQQTLLLFAVGLQILVFGRNDRLRLELLEVGTEFSDDVFDADQILTRVVQTVLGFAAAFLVLRHARGFFEKHAQALPASPRSGARSCPAR